MTGRSRRRFAAPPVSVFACAWRLSSALLWALAAAPGIANAATPTRPPGLPPEVPPVPDTLKSIIDLVIGVVASGLVIVAIGACVWGLAKLVARLGARRNPIAGVAGPWRLGTTSVVVRAVLAILAIGGLAFGVAVGRYLGYRASLGGLESIGVAITGGLFGLVIVVLLVVGIVAIRVRGGFSTPIAALLLATGLAGAGAAGGWATAGVTGGTYVAPVEHSAKGSTRAELSATLVPFVPRDAGEADCRSVPDGEAVAGITALDLGELGSGTLRADFGPGSSVGDSVGIELFIDGGDVAEGAAQPFWSGTAQVVELGSLGVSGQLRFDRLPAESNAKTSAAQTGWDAPLTGSISWTCQPW